MNNTWKQLRNAKNCGSTNTGTSFHAKAKVTAHVSSSWTKRQMPQQNRRISTILKYTYTLLQFRSKTHLQASATTFVATKAHETAECKNI